MRIDFALTKHAPHKRRLYRSLLGTPTAAPNQMQTHLIDHKGRIFVTGLIDLSDEAAESLAKRATKFSEHEITLDDMPHSAAAILRDAGHGV